MTGNKQQRINELKPATKTLGELAQRAGVPMHELLKAAQELEIEFWSGKSGEFPHPPDAARIYFAWPQDNCTLYACFVGSGEVGETAYGRRLEISQRERTTYFDAISVQEINFPADRIVLPNLYDGLTYSMLTEYHEAEQAVTASAFSYALDIGTSEVVGAHTLNPRCFEHRGAWEIRLYDSKEGSPSRGGADQPRSLVVHVRDLVVLPKLVPKLLRRVALDFAITKHSLDVQLLVGLFEKYWVKASDDAWKSWRLNFDRELEKSQSFQSKNVQSLIYWIFDSLHVYTRSLAKLENEEEKSGFFSKRDKSDPPRMKILLDVSTQFWGEWDERSKRPAQNDVERALLVRGFTGKKAGAAAKLVAKARRPNPQDQV